MKEGSGKAGLKLSTLKNYDQGIWFHHFMAQRKKSGSTDRFFFSWVSKSLWMVTAAVKLKDICSLEEKL